MNDGTSGFPAGAIDRYAVSVEQKSGAYLIESVDRALQLLVLLRDSPSVSVTDAAAALGVAPSTAHRLLATLSHRGWAAQGERRLYTAGPELTASVSRSSGIRAVVRNVRPYTEALYAELGETVHVQVLSGPEVRFVDGIESNQNLRVGLRIGSHMPAHTTSGGKAMLAELSRQELEALNPGGPRPWPGSQVTTLEQLHAEMGRVRSRQFGLNQEESEPGVAALGASLGIVGGQFRVALTVAVPTARFSGPAARRIAGVLQATTALARAELGGPGAMFSGSPAGG